MITPKILGQISQESNILYMKAEKNYSIFLSRKWLKTRFGLYAEISRRLSGHCRVYPPQPLDTYTKVIRAKHL